MVVEHLIADGAQLDIATIGREKPLHFEIHRLRLGDVSATRSMSFSTTLTEPVMKGEVRADGELGPIETADPGETQVTATYKLMAANLNAFHNPSGMVSSTGRFEGPLKHIALTGLVDIPDFRYKQAHVTHLASRYEAIVNGTTGDVMLAPGNSASRQNSHLVRLPNRGRL